MKFDPDIHHRRSIRLKGYDYSQTGAYFVTICTKDRECLFGNVTHGEMILNEAGEMVKRVWRDLPIRYSGIEIDEYIVMPNHIHGIIIVGADPRVCPNLNGVCPDLNGVCPNLNGVCPNLNGVCPDIKDINGQPQGVAPTNKLLLGDVVQRFKSFVTSQYRLSVERHNWVRFNGKLWQRNYYEHIIRNETDLNKIREYIISNPLNWETDENYR